MRPRAAIELKSSRAPWALLLAIVFSVPSTCRAGEPARAREEAADAKEGGHAVDGNDDLKITIVYDNCPFKEGLTAKWGFACVIEGLGRTILFDTGGDADVLLPNMAEMGFRPEQVQCVVLSHAHGDHTGGLTGFLKANGNVKVFVPKVFPAGFREALRRSAAEVVETEGPCRVCEGAWTTGVLTKPLAEQGLYLHAREGLVVVTGCAHPGAARMAEAAHRHAKRPVFAVLGGFHLARASDDEIDATIRALRGLDVQRVAPSHCSGDEMRRACQEALGDAYV